MTYRLCPNYTRKPLVESVPIRLTDGQSWGLARAVLMLRPRFVNPVEANDSDDAAVFVDTYHGFPLNTEKYLEPLRTAALETPNKIPWDVVFRAAAALLMQAHTVNLEDALELLTIENDRLHELVSSIAEALQPVDTDTATEGTLVDSINHVGEVS